MKTKETSTNNTLLNIIALMELEFRRNYLILGENKGRVYGIIKYPQDLKYGWLSKITNIPGTICSINFTPMGSGIFVENAARSISRNRGLANSTNDPLTRSRAEKAAEDEEKIMRSIDQQGEGIGQMGITIMPILTEDNLFEKACRKVESRVTAINCRLRNLSYLQEEGFKQLSPFYTIEKDIENITNRIVSLSTFVGGFPFASSGYNDGKGYYFAKDGSGGLVIVDPWKREEDRTNSNFVIMGVPGVGKSIAIKHIVLSEYMGETKLIFIDPHRQYWELCKNLNGDWINARGGNKGKINLL